MAEETAKALTLEDERDLLFAEMQRHPLYWDGRDGHDDAILYPDEIEYEDLAARYLDICERIMERDGERR